jgi:hypothetical protein
MAEPTPKPADSVGIPSVDELRRKGRERLMVYFQWFNVTPPDDLDEMARAAHELLLKEASAVDADWEDYLKQDGWVALDDVLGDLGIDDSEGSANEPAA